MIETFITFLNAFPPEFIWVISLLFSFAAVLLFFRILGKTGLYLYMAIALIAANIQVLKVVQFSVFPDPVALGTILFSSTFLCTDILAECYGSRAARKGVLAGFLVLICWNVFMILSLGFSPLTPEQAGDTNSWALPVQGYMQGLFQPAPIFLIASLFSYLVSQFNDVWLFEFLHRLTGQKHLWIRNNVSTMVSALIDSTVFSLLAWIVLPKLLGGDPLPWNTVLMTYILGTYILRIAVAFLDTPFIYLARLIKKSPHTFIQNS